MNRRCNVLKVIMRHLPCNQSYHITYEKMLSFFHDAVFPSPISFSRSVQRIMELAE